LVYIDENNQNKKESSFFRKLFKWV
jgi:hypothetical protein